MPDSPAIALIEYSSIAAGTRAADIIVKKAPVTVLRSGTVQPGKYAILFEGEVAAVEESLLAGCHAAADVVLDRILLPDVHEAVRAAVIKTPQSDWDFETVGGAGFHRPLTLKRVEVFLDGGRWLSVGSADRLE